MACRGHTPRGHTQGGSASRLRGLGWLWRKGGHAGRLGQVVQVVGGAGDAWTGAGGGRRGGRRLGLWGSGRRGPRGPDISAGGRRADAAGSSDPGVSGLPGVGLSPGPRLALPCSCAGRSGRYLGGPRTVGPARGLRPVRLPAGLASGCALPTAIHVWAHRSDGGPNPRRAALAAADRGRASTPGNA